MKIGSTAINDIKVGSTPVNKVYRNGVLYWEAIPNILDSLLWLDGTILNNSGTYYFIDKSGNSRNFLITNYDFDSTWTLGFPYKSAATISAPVGDATLISADINNYLYASNGTPNQIPVISLFQDVDYEHKLFARHIAQVVDGNGVETYEPRVVDIVLYNTVKAGADLTNCNTFYGVPTESGTAKWVSKNGNDTTGTGTKVLPYLTIAKAKKSITSGGTIYVKTGDYLEQENASLLYLYVDKGAVFKSLGFCKITSQAAQIFWAIGAQANDIISFEGFILDANSSRVGLRLSLAIDMRINRCYLKNYASYGLFMNNLSTGNLSVTNCVFKSSVTTGASIHSTITENKCNISNNFFTPDTTGQQCIVASYADIKFNKIKATVSASSISLGVINSYSVIDNIIENIKQQGIYITGTALSEFTINIKYNKLTCHTTIPGALTYLALGNAYTSTHYVIDNNQIYQNNTSVPITVRAVNVLSSVSCTCINNYFYHNSSRGAIFYNATAVDAVYGAHNVNYNYIDSKSEDSFLISIGQENDGVYNTYPGTTIIGNKIIGNLVYNSNSTEVHAIFISNANNSKVLYNYIEGCKWGVVCKMGGHAWDIGDYGVNYNVLINNSGSGLIFQGTNNVPCHNNTIYTNISNSRGIMIELDNPTPSINQNFINNLIYLDGAHSAFFCYTAQVLNGCKFENNHIYKPNSSFALVISASTYSTVALAQTAGYLNNCTEQSFNFNSIENKQFWPTVEVSTGENLGSSYNTGLDASTDWGSDTEIPTVVTKTQPANWDIGAYIH